MVAKRIIPCLDVKDGRTVKGVNFVGLRDVGDAVELGAEYARQGLAKNRTFSREANDGTLHTRTYLVWTERGREFIHRLFDKNLAN